jgi:Tol biopolymer transport system component
MMSGAAGEVIMGHAVSLAGLAVISGFLLTGARPAEAGEATPAGTIAFSSLAPRGWDLYRLEIETREIRRLTRHDALDFNASFAPDGNRIVFVSERDGNPEIYAIDPAGSSPRRLTDCFALDDQPRSSPDGRRIAFCSTRQPADVPGRAWNAIYVMEADGSNPRRITPEGIADYAPAWSPKGDLIACTSGSGETGRSSLVVMAPDGSQRREILADGGWPAFAADGQGLYFHSKRDGRWGIWRVGLDGSGLERVSPADVEAFTPSTSADGGQLVVAVRRGARRQIARLDVRTRALTDLTDGPLDDWNPAIAPDGRSVVFHRAASPVAPNVEVWGGPPETGLRLLRLNGAFPAFGPDARRLALTGGSFGRLDVMNVDGSDRRTLYTGQARGLFSISWAHHGDRIAFSLGGVFQGAGGDVDLLTIRPDGSDARRITSGSGNDGFPAFAPDGQRLVFRSGRGGSKNLYLMGVGGSDVRPLTQGRWTDTMPDWSPTGEWIAFASDRDGDFEIWLVHPDGTGLRKLVAGGGRNNHPHWSPDGRWIVFTSKRAGYSAEEIALPSQPQPYGELFAVRADGSSLIRLTHNGFEEGTPAWGPVLDIKEVAGATGKAEDY